MMVTVVEVATLAIIIISAIVGIVKGFAKTFISTFGTILSLVFAILLSSAVAGFLENTFSLITKLSGKLIGVVENIFGAELSATPLANASEASLASGNLAGWLVSHILSLKGDSAVNQSLPVGQILASTFAYYIAVVIAVIITFIIFKIIFFIIGDLIVKARKISVINVVDRVLGLVLGIIKGIIWVNFVFMIIKFLPFGFCQDITYALECSTFARFINTINVFGLLLGVISAPSKIIPFL